MVGSEAHLYVGDMDTPAMTLRGDHARRGHLGFKPRNPGGSVLVDDLTVTAIDGFTYRGDPVPTPAYRPQDFVTDWSVLGPLTRHAEEVEGRECDPSLVVEDDGPATLFFSTADDIVSWVNGAFRGYATRGSQAWWESAVNVEPQPVRSFITLQEGQNHAVVRVMGGTYATGGFFMAVREDR